MRIQIIESDDWDAVYVDGEISLQGSFGILSHLEEILVPGTVIEEFRSFYVTSAGQEGLYESGEFPEEYEQIPEEWLA